MPDKLYISKVYLPDGNTYEIKDLEARDLIETLSHIGLSFIRSTNAATTPAGVTWNDGQTQIVGTLQPSSQIKNIYLVPETTNTGKSAFIEYVCVIIGQDAEEHDIFAWEAIGSTDASLDELGNLAYADTASGSATFTGQTGAINVTGTFTAEGTVSKPAVDVTAPKATFNAGSLPTKASDTWVAPSLTAEVAPGTEILTISFNAGSYTEGAFTQGSLPTLKDNNDQPVTQVVSGVSAELHAAPEFTGTAGQTITASSAGNNISVTGTVQVTPDSN